MTAPSYRTWLIVAVCTLPLYLIVIVMLFMSSSSNAVHQRIKREQSELRVVITEAEEACRRANVIP